MKKRTMLGFAALLAAGAYAAVKLLEQDTAAPTAVSETPQGAPEASAAPEADADDTVAYPLKNKFTDHTDEAAGPVYLFELETPNGVKEVTVDFAQYETYYIGDEVICRETDKGLSVL